MSSVQEAVRRLTIQSTAQGVDTTTTQLLGLAGAQEKVAVASDKTERATLSLESKFASIERRYVTAVRAQQDYEKTQRAVNAAVAQNPALQDRANAVMAAAEERLRRVTIGANDNAAAMTRQAAATEQAAAAQQRMAAIQSVVNRYAGVSEGGDSAARAADIEAYGQAMDRLQAKYDPMFAAQQRLKESTDAIAAAQRAGAITAEVALQARLKEINAYNAEVSALQSVGAARKAAAQAMVNQQTVVPNRGADIAAYGKQLDDLRAKYNPLYRASREYEAALVDIDHAAKVGAISDAERAAAIQQTKGAYAQQVTSLKASAQATADLTTKSGLARHELINLGRQAQDVGTMFAMGAQPMQIFTSQAAQIFDVFASSRGTLSGFFAQMMEGVSAFAMSSTGALTLVGAVLVAGVAAAVSYSNAQNEVQRSLMGTGRAAGITVDQINAVVKATSGKSGLSTSEATEFAASLVSTGRVAVESLQPALEVAKGLAKVLGTDMKGAAQEMAQALSGNFQSINARLGAFSVATQEQYKALMAQNREVEAQALVLEKVRSATAGASDVTSGWSRAWTALGNAASNAWTAIGRGIDGALGMNKSIADQFKEAVAQIEQLQKKRAELAKSPTGPDLSAMTPEQRERAQFMLQLNPAADAANRNLAAIDDAIKKAQTAADGFKRSMDNVKKATEETKAAMQSLADQTLVTALSPEIQQRRDLRNQTASAESLAADPTRQAAFGMTQAQADEQVRRAQSVEKGFRTAGEKMAEGYDVANKAITAFTPQQKASIAYLQAEIALRDNPNMSGEEKKLRAQDAYNNALKQESVALSEQARARVLYANQAVEQAQLEVDLVGKSIGQQAEARANLQAEQAIRQQLAQNHQQWGKAQDAEMAQLREINKLYGQRAQLAAVKQAQSQTDFASQTLFMSGADLAAAQVMHNIYGDEWQSHMDDALAKQIKMNALITDIKGTSQQFTGDFVKGLMSGKGAMEALAEAAQNLSNKMADKALESLFSGDFLSAGVQGSVALVAGLFAADQKAKQKLEQAQKAWREAGPAFQKFLTEMSGGAQGDLAASIENARQQMQSLADKAWDAKDYAALARIQSSFVRFELSQATRFQQMFNATLQGLADGLGMDSPFSKAVEAVKGQLQTVQKFIDDAITSNTTEYMSTYVDVDAARSASMSYLLTLLQTAPKLSEVQTGMLHIQGTATALQGALTQLGMSAEDATYWINAGVGTAIAQLKKTFEDGLAARLNTATGKSYFNDTAALIAQHAQDLADAAMLGTDAGVVSRLFRAEAQKIVEDAGLVGDAFKDFTRQFPELAGIVTESSDALAAAAKTQQDALNSSAKSIVDYVSGLMTGSQAGMSPQDRFTAAQATYNQKLALAQVGNVDAMATIAQDFETYRAAAREMFGSTEQYQQILATGISQLLTLPAVQQTTDPVVQAMRDVLLAVQEGNATLVDVELAAQISAAKTAEAAAQAQRTADLQATANNLSGTANSLTSAANAILNQQASFLNSIAVLQSTAADQLGLLRNALAPSNVAVGASPDFGGGAILSNQAIDALNKIVWNTHATARNLQLLASNSYQHGPLPGAISGVYRDGGLAEGPGSGTSDSIPIWVSNGEGIIKESVMTALGGRQAINAINAGRFPMVPVPVPMRGQNDNGDMRAVLEELRAVKGELAAIKGNTGRAVAVAAEGAQQIRDSVDRGNDLQADTNKRLRRTS